MVGLFCGWANLAGLFCPGLDGDWGEESDGARAGAKKTEMEQKMWQEMRKDMEQEIKCTMEQGMEAGDESRRYKIDVGMEMLMQQKTQMRHRIFVN